MWVLSSLIYLIKWVLCFYLVAVHLGRPAAKVGLSDVSPLAAPPHLERAASSSQSGFAKSFRELPTRYRRKPLDDVEIEYIQVSGHFLSVDAFCRFANLISIKSGCLVMLSLDLHFYTDLHYQQLNSDHIMISTVSLVRSKCYLHTVKT